MEGGETMVDKDLLKIAAKLASSQIIANAIAITTNKTMIASQVKPQDLIKLTATYYKSLDSINK